MKTAIIASLMMISLVPVLAAGESRTEERKARLAERAAQREKILEERKELTEKRAEYTRHVESTTAMEFEKKNSEKDLLRGKVTHSVIPKDGQSGYVAYILIRWGDLDEKIPDISPDYYSNWDGYVKVQGGGKASVVKEFAFDDRNSRTGGVDRGDGIGRDSGRRPGTPNEPGEGSGHDELIKDTQPSMVAWKSGIVGATDGLLIKLTLKKAQAKGTIRVGNFTIPYEITPMPQR